MLGVVTTSSLRASWISGTVMRLPVTLPDLTVDFVDGLRW
jgi:hypothetical protein